MPDTRHFRGPSEPPCVSMRSTQGSGKFLARCVELLLMGVRFSLFLVIFCCQAQIRELATTDSGDQLYFTTLLGVRNAESLPNSKIMRWSAAHGLEILAQRANQ